MAPAIVARSRPRPSPTWRPSRPPTTAPPAAPTPLPAARVFVSLTLSTTPQLLHTGVAACLRSAARSRARSRSRSRCSVSSRTAAVLRGSDAGTTGEAMTSFAPPLVPSAPLPDVDTPLTVPAPAAYWLDCTAADGGEYG